MSTPPTRVLVVDADREYAQTVSDVLIQRGLHVRVTDDPDRAQAAAEGCDVALLDLGMPRKTGLELAGRLKARDPDLQRAAAAPRPQVQQVGAARAEYRRHEQGRLAPLRPALPR